MEKRELPKELKSDLERAIKMYYNVAFKDRIKLEDHELYRLVNGSLEMLSRDSFSELRLGVLGWPHTKLFTELCSSGYRFYLSANCDKRSRKRVERECAKIEKAFKKATIPVEEIYSKE